MSTSKVATNRCLDKINVSNQCRSLESKTLKVFSKLPDICFIIKGRYTDSNVKLRVYFEGDNRKRTLRAKMKLRVDETALECEGYLPDSGKEFCSLEIPEQDPPYEFSMSASIFSDSLQLESGMRTAVDKGPALTDSFQELFDLGAGSDVTLSASGEDFKAHKFLLSARSTVFRAMFATVMREQQTQRVEITDMEPEVLKEVLRYIYTNRVLNIDQLAPRLVYMAEKYALQGLKDLCQDELCLTLTEDNALDLLVTADLVGCTLLKKLATMFVMGKVDVLCTTEKWKDFAKKCPMLLSDMFAISANVRKVEDSQWQ